MKFEFNDVHDNHNKYRFENTHRQRRQKGGKFSNQENFSKDSLDLLYRIPIPSLLFPIFQS